MFNYSQSAEIKGSGGSFSDNYYYLILMKTKFIEYSFKQTWILHVSGKNI